MTKLFMILELLILLTLSAMKHSVEKKKWNLSFITPDEIINIFKKFGVTKATYDAIFLKIFKQKVVIVITNNIKPMQSLSIVSKKLPLSELTRH